MCQSTTLSRNSTGPTPTRTPISTLGMRLSCNFVNAYTIAYRVQYTFIRVHLRIPNGHLREEKRACRTSRRTSRRGSSCVSGSWQAERGSRRTRRHPRDDPRAEVGEDVCVNVAVGVCVAPVEFQFYATPAFICLIMGRFVYLVQSQCSLVVAIG